MRLLRRPAGDETHAWVVSAALLAPHAVALRSLSEAACGRVDRELGRGFLRVLLGGYLGLHPWDVEIERRCPACGGPHGPPIARDLRISISYTPGRVAYALATSPVGIDIEALRPNVEWKHVAPLVLPPEDVERVQRAPLQNRAAAFLRAWTRREALGKATGSGLLDAPARQSVPPGFALTAQPLALPPSYVAAVARSTRRLSVYSATDVLPSFLDLAGAV